MDNPTVPLTGVSSNDLTHHVVLDLTGVRQGPAWRMMVRLYWPSIHAVRAAVEAVTGPERMALIAKIGEFVTGLEIPGAWDTDPNDEEEEEEESEEEEECVDDLFERFSKAIAETVEASATRVAQDMEQRLTKLQDALGPTRKSSLADALDGLTAEELAVIIWTGSANLKEGTLGGFRNLSEDASWSKLSQGERSAIVAKAQRIWITLKNRAERIGANRAQAAGDLGANALGANTPPKADTERTAIAIFAAVRENLVGVEIGALPKDWSSLTTYAKQKFIAVAQHFAKNPPETVNPGP